MCRYWTWRPEKNTLRVFQQKWRLCMYLLCDFIITLFFHQSDQFVTDFCTVITENCTVLQKIALWLQKIALLFGINCTEINQSQLSNIFMYIIKTVM
jgi:hypothetical protein